MARVLPFRGIRYDLSKAGSLDSLVSPPYDVIGPDLQVNLYSRSSYNIVRIDYGLVGEGDDESDNRYTRAGATFRDWLQSGILRQDPEPSLYYIEEHYRAEGEPKTRQGLLGLVQLEDAGSGVYHPHEKTLAGPKTDRMKLMQSCRANLSPIFGLYDDPVGSVLRELSCVSSKEPPLLSVRTDDGVENRLWRCADPGIVRHVGCALQEKGFFIADGHHRYETALAYRDQMRRASPRHSEQEPWNFVMMYLSNLWAPGLSILPTHRAVYGIPDFRLERILRELGGYFEVEAVRGGLSELLERLKLARGGQPVFGMGAEGGEQFWLLVLKRDASPSDLLSPRVSDVLRGLDVTVLHSLVLERILGISERAQEEHRNIQYVKESLELHGTLRDRGVQLGFFLNPTRIDQVKAVAERGERMPQKSTFFYPKLLTGLVINPLFEVTAPCFGS